MKAKLFFAPRLALRRGTRQLLCSTSIAAGPAMPAMQRTTPVPGAALRSARLRRNLSQVLLASRAGCSVNTVALAERGGSSRPRSPSGSPGSSVSARAALWSRCRRTLISCDPGQFGGVVNRAQLTSGRAAIAQVEWRLSRKRLGRWCRGCRWLPLGPWSPSSLRAGGAQWNHP